MFKCVFIIVNPNKRVFIVVNPNAVPNTDSKIRFFAPPPTSPGASPADEDEVDDEDAAWTAHAPKEFVERFVPAVPRINDTVFLNGDHYQVIDAPVWKEFIEEGVPAPILVPYVCVEKAHMMRAPARTPGR